MAQFKGFECDSCGTVMSRDQRTRVIHRYEGFGRDGEYSEDLCSTCLPPLPEDVKLRPLRRRRPAQRTAS